MSNKNQVLTTVKIDIDLFEKFKIECILYKFCKYFRNVISLLKFAIFS